MNLNVLADIKNFVERETKKRISLVAKLSSLIYFLTSMILSALKSLEPTVKRVSSRYHEPNFLEVLVVNLFVMILIFLIAKFICYSVVIFKQILNGDKKEERSN